MGPIEKLLNMIYPPKCVFCGELLNINSAVHICGGCREKLPFTDSNVFRTSQESGARCWCDGAVSVFRYDGIVKEALKRYKFHDRPGYCKTFARLMADRLAEPGGLRRYDLVMGVPLHRNREYERGYNQAYLLSRALSVELGLPEGSKFMGRARQTRAQSLLDRQDRQDNIRDAFIVKAPEKIKGRSVLLVDDIMTTGSTLEECGRMLKLAGAVKVTAAVVATGRDYHGEERNYRAGTGNYSWR